MPPSHRTTLPAAAAPVVLSPMALPGVGVVVRVSVVVSIVVVVSMG